MKILVGCEESGVVREAFRALGHEAWSCDILPTRVEGPHYQRDVREVLDEGWDMAIFHPPCTYMSLSGSVHLYNKDKTRNEERWAKLEESALFFKSLWESKIPMIAMENPIILKAAINIIGRKYDQIVQPYMFGDEFTKPTCLWLKNLPLLKPSNVVGKGEYHVTSGGKRIPKWYNLPPSEDRARIRSTTFPGFASAMAQQWGSLDTAS